MLESTVPNSCSVCCRLRQETQVSVARDQTTGTATKSAASKLNTTVSFPLSLVGDLGSFGGSSAAESTLMGPPRAPLRTHNRPFGPITPGGTGPVMSTPRTAPVSTNQCLPDLGTATPFAAAGRPAVQQVDLYAWQLQMQQQQQQQEQQFQQQQVQHQQLMN